jgi:glycerate-2-kinase
MAEEGREAAAMGVAEMAAEKAAAVTVEEGMEAAAMGEAVEAEVATAAEVVVRLARAVEDRSLREELAATVAPEAE